MFMTTFSVAIDHEFSKRSVPPAVQQHSHHKCGCKLMYLERTSWQQNTLSNFCRKTTSLVKSVRVFCP